MDKSVERDIDNEVVVPDLAEDVVEESPKGTLLSVILDDKGYVTQFCTGATLSNETAHFYTDIPIDFFSLYRAYRVEKDILILDTKAIDAVEQENDIEALRSMREVECFQYVDRGQLWYSRLTAEQLKELDTWYQEWLDITEQKGYAKSGPKIPERPGWLV